MGSNECIMVVNVMSKNVKLINVGVCNMCFVWLWEICIIMVMIIKLMVLIVIRWSVFLNKIIGLK